MKGNKNKPKNIIFIIGDGMGLAEIHAGMTANKGHLNMERAKYIGLSTTSSASFYAHEKSRNDYENTEVFNKFLSVLSVQ